MKRYILSLIALTFCTVINAQVINVYDNGVLTKTYINTADKTYKVVIEDEKLLPGKFTVAYKTQVQFTKSNLYWDGSTFRFEANQTDYPTQWGTGDAAGKHVGHFYWAKTAADSYNVNYQPSDLSTSDKFWLDGSDADHKLTVEGQEGLYALSKEQWYYLHHNRPNASSLIKFGVTVYANGIQYKNCLIIAPDGFAYTLQGSYNLEEINTLGLVCLPAAGFRSGQTFQNNDKQFGYWTSTPNDVNLAYYFYYTGDLKGTYLGYRQSGCSIRLVK